MFDGPVHLKPEAELSVLISDDLVEHVASMGGVL